MGFFGDIVETFSEFHQGLCDIAEYATVGFVEEIIKGNGTYKTSYEKRDEASSIYASSNRRLNDASASLNSMVDELNEKIRSLNVRKRELLNNMNCGVSVMSYRLPTGYSTSSSSDSFGVLLNRSDLVSTCIRISRANEYLEDAQGYRAECNEKIARINNMKVRLNAVESVLDEESHLLDILERSQNDTRFTKSNKFAKELQQLLTKHICSTDGELDRSYVQNIENLRTLCRWL